MFLKFIYAIGYTERFPILKILNQVAFIRLVALDWYRPTIFELFMYYTWIDYRIWPGSQLKPCWLRHVLFLFLNQVSCKNENTSWTVNHNTLCARGLSKVLSLLKSIAKNVLNFNLRKPRKQGVNVLHGFEKILIF